MDAVRPVRARRELAVRNTLGSIGEDLRIQRRRRFRFAPLPRDFRMFVFVLGVARRAARLFDVAPEHRDHGVISQAPLTWAIIIKYVTKPKLALLHLRSRRIRWRG